MCFAKAIAICGGWRWVSSDHCWRCGQSKKTLATRVEEGLGFSRAMAASTTSTKRAV